MRRRGEDNTFEATEVAVEGRPQESAQTCTHTHTKRERPPLETQAEARDQGINVGACTKGDGREGSTYWCRRRRGGGRRTAAPWPGDLSRLARRRKLPEEGCAAEAKWGILGSVPCRLG